MSAQDVIDCTNLMYQYCWTVDSGDFEAVGEMLKYADVSYDGRLAYSCNPAAYLKTMRSIIKYEDGTPKTMHLCVNPMVEVDEATETATGRSYTIVTQGVPGQFMPQIIWMDRKYDTFKKVDGKWVFASRNFVTHCSGDSSAHMKPYGKK